MKFPTYGVEIKDHPAGAYLNALFCTEVMKWKLTENVRYLLDRTNWSPSTNISHAFEGEDRIKEPDEQLRYVECLISVIEHDKGCRVRGIDIFEIAHATAHQRTRALVMWAMEKK